MARFVYRCPLRWSDMDAFAHVNNVVYLTYLEQARVAMFFDYYDSSFAQGTVISDHQIRYLRPVVYSPTPLRIELWVDGVRGASFDVRYEVFDDSAVLNGSAVSDDSAVSDGSAVLTDSAVSDGSAVSDDRPKRGSGVLAASARSTCVTFDFQANRPRRMTPAEREVLAGLTDGPRTPTSTGS